MQMAVNLVENFRVSRVQLNDIRPVFKRRFETSMLNEAAGKDEFVIREHLSMKLYSVFEIVAKFRSSPTEVLPRVGEILEI